MLPPGPRESRRGGRPSPGPYERGQPNPPVLQSDAPSVLYSAAMSIDLQLLATDQPVMDYVWFPVWLVLAFLFVVGGLVWYFALPDREEGGFEALMIAFLGPAFSLMWPILFAGGLIAGFLWSLTRLRLRMYPRLKIPATDLRTKYPVPEDDPIVHPATYAAYREEPDLETNAEC